MQFDLIPIRADFVTFPHVVPVCSNLISKDVIKYYFKV